MKKKLTTVFLICIFLIGLSLLLYPLISQWWNARYQLGLIADYQGQVQALEKTDYKQIWDRALAYNQGIAQRENLLLPSDRETEAYPELLNMGGTGIMGYLEIPSIDVQLPIYHGTERGVLQVALGHLEWSGLPVGGAGTHCVLSGHRGLPSAELLTDLDRMEQGDLFRLRVLDEVLSYEVDQILIVEPDELSALMPQQGQDLCTLVTCTPYGVNSHRLLVRGHRIEEGTPQQEHVPADAAVIDRKIVAVVLAVPLVLIFGSVIFVKKYRRP